MTSIGACLAAAPAVRRLAMVLMLCFASSSLTMVVHLGSAEAQTGKIGDAVDPVIPLQQVPSNAATDTRPTTLPHNLTPWGMFLAADIVVKTVMVGLAAASFIVWTVWIAKSFELLMSRRALKGSRTLLGRCATLDEATAAMTSGKGLATAFLEATRTELSLSSGGADKAGLQERVASRIAEIEAAAIRSIRAGTGFLATVGATAPFVGLFGTVWGIMNSFIGISRSQTTNLAVVAPGIAEALLATAIGLVAAIPAVILYNQLARTTAAYKALVRENAAEVLRLLSRDLDRRTMPGIGPRARAAE